MITFDRKFGDGAATLLMNTKFVTLIEDNSVPLAEKANLLSHENLACILNCCESEQLNFTDMLRTLGKLLAERDGLGSMAMVDAAEMLRFAGNLKTLIGGLSFCLEEIGRETKKISNYLQTSVCR